MTLDSAETPPSRLGRRPAGGPRNAALAAAVATLLMFLASVPAPLASAAAPATTQAGPTGPAAGAATEDVARVVGVVRDPAGKPVAGARVVVVENRRAADLLPPGL